MEENHSSGRCENVLTVGAIDKKKLLAPFSSVAILPRTCETGCRSSRPQGGYSGTDGNLRLANGTSFSSPIMCGW